MKRPTSLPVLVQVAALAVLAVVMSQAVAFGVVVLAPEPRPAGFSIATAANALKGLPAETSDGRALRRRLTSQPILPEPEPSPDPVAVAIRAALAQTMDVPPESVRVRISRPPSGRSVRSVRRPQPGPPGSGFVFVDRIETGRASPALRARAVATPEAPSRLTVTGPDGEVRTTTNRPRVRAIGGGTLVLENDARAFSIIADRLTFAPFAASVLQADGRWATVEPPRGLLSPWQQRVLLALAISLLLLAPLVWFMARRLTRPIRVFAEAAERLGANPDAEPLKPSGPSEVRTAIHAFNDMQASLRDHMRRRTQTVAAIAHDLRTPLTRLRFRAEQAPDAVRDRMAGDIEEMDALIAQAMAYVRGETPSERRERFDLSALAMDCAGGFAETGAAVRFADGAILPVDGDPAALRRALSNLIANAVKYGGSARVVASAGNGRAVVTVEDDGPGLPEEELETVFEPFHRAERSRNRETGGAGLGLTVARQAARAMGGDVTLGNRPEGGLSARLDVPLAS